MKKVQGQTCIIVISIKITLIFWYYDKKKKIIFYFYDIFLLKDSTSNIDSNFMFFNESSFPDSKNQDDDFLSNIDESNGNSNKNSDTSSLESDTNLYKKYKGKLKIIVSLTI